MPTTDIHHLFIFSGNQGKEADELLRFGLVEGSSGNHKGQGTSSRKFYFKNFYLEILWVSDYKQFLNGHTSSVKLDERAMFQSNGCSPFGMCMINSEKTRKIFDNSIRYSPGFLPEGTFLQVLPNEHEPYLPWMFLVPFISDSSVNGEPVIHSHKMEYLTKIIFHVPVTSLKSNLARFFNDCCVVFEYGGNYSVTLEFDQKKKGKIWSFGEVPLHISY